MKYQLLKDGQFLTVVSTCTPAPTIKQVDVTTSVNQLAIDYSMGLLGVEVSIRVPPMANYEPQRAARAAVLEVANAYRVSEQAHTITIAETFERFLPVAVLELQNLMHCGPVFIGVADDVNRPGASIKDESVVIYLPKDAYGDPQTMARELFMATYQAKMLRA